jgi:dual specificity phosphatase 12
MCDFIDEQHRDGKRVLVHCNAGESRSVAVVTAYLVRRDGIKLETALDMVRKGRKTAQPNFGFMEQLEIWEEVGYEVWMDGMVPKRPYQQFLQERAMDPR